jgi:hypothetical protein
LARRAVTPDDVLPASIHIMREKAPLNFGVWNFLTENGFGLVPALPVAEVDVGDCNRETVVQFLDEFIKHPGISELLGIATSICFEVIEN